MSDSRDMEEELQKQQSTREADHFDFQRAVIQFAVWLCDFYS